MEINIVAVDSDKKYDFSICFDEYGNLYLDGTKYINDEYFTNPSSLLFQINIDKDNKPFGDGGEYNIISDVISVNKLPLDENKDYDQGKEQDDRIDQDKWEFIIELDSDGNEIIYEDNPKFIYYGNFEIPINDRENGDIAALYDTELYNINNTCIMTATSGDNSSIYKIKISQHGYIYFSCIGNNEIKYNLSINKIGELFFNVVS